MVSVPKLRLVLPLLLNVTNFTALVVPTGWLPKDREEGEKLTVAKLATARTVRSIGNARIFFNGISPDPNITVRLPLLTSGKPSHRGRINTALVLSALAQTLNNQRVS